jgi:hypothetical protein
MRAPLLVGLALFVSAAALPPGSAAKSPSPAPASAQQAAPQAGQPTGVDAIIELVKANVSESLVLKSIQREGKTYDLTPADVLKLQKAGASEKIINAMMDPASASAPPAPGAAVAPAPAQTPAPAPAVAPAPKGAQVSDTSAPRSQPTTAVATPKPKGGLFSNLKDKLGQTAKGTVDSTTSTFNKAAGDTISGAGEAANLTLKDTQTAVDQNVQCSEKRADSSVSEAVGIAPPKAIESAQGSAADKISSATKTGDPAAKTGAAQPAAKTSAALDKGAAGAQKKLDPKAVGRPASAPAAASGAAPGAGPAAGSSAGPGAHAATAKKDDCAVPAVPAAPAL